MTGPPGAGMGRGWPSHGEHLDDRPVYVISVAAELAGMHPQTLRGYDRMGLVSPGRSGRARRYSERDVAALREIARLSQQDGVGLAGVRQIMVLQRDIAVLQDEVRTLSRQLAEARLAATDGMAAAVSALRMAARRDLVPLRSQPGTSVVVWRPRRARRG